MKKIVIFIITVLVLGVIAMCSCIANSKRIEQEKIKESVADVTQEENTEQDIIENQHIDIAKEEIINAEEIKEKQSEIQKEQPIQNNRENNKIIVEEQESKNTEIIEIETPNNQAIEEQPKTEEISKAIIKETPNNDVVMTKKEEYKRNDAMIERIKQTIINNETDNMKNYEYNIVIDSSIKNLTNQFTYTESRVINNIKYSFGTIKVYAEDYIVNGQVVMTECYIL